MKLVRQRGVDSNVSNPIYLGCGTNLTPRGHEAWAHTSTFCGVGMMGLVRKLHSSAGVSAARVPVELCQKGPTALPWSLDALTGTEKVAIITLLQLLCPHFVSTVPQQGKLLITTEFGKMLVEPNEICVIQVRAECTLPLAQSQM